MTTFEKCCAIRRMILNRAAEVMAYENWSEEFAVGQIRNFPKDLAEKEIGKDYFGIQPVRMTAMERKNTNATDPALAYAVSCRRDRGGVH